MKSETAQVVALLRREHRERWARWYDTFPWWVERVAQDRLSPLRVKTTGRAMVTDIVQAVSDFTAVDKN